MNSVNLSNSRALWILVAIAFLAACGLGYFLLRHEAENEGMFLLRSEVIDGPKAKNRADGKQKPVKARSFDDKPQAKSDGSVSSSNFFK